MQAKLTQKAKFPTQRDGPRVSGSSEKNARLGGLASVKGRRYLFSLKIKPLTLFLAYNRAEQVDFLGSRIFSVGKICVLRGTYALCDAITCRELGHCDLPFFYFLPAVPQLHFLTQRVLKQ